MSLIVQKFGGSSVADAAGIQRVARRVADTVRAIGASRFGLKYSNATLPHGPMMRSIELYGSRVIPLVRDMLSEG